MSTLIIAIDGPSASGKSTLGRLLARALNLLYVDTGSMYRAVALAVIERGIDPTDTEAVALLAESLAIEMRGDPDSLQIILNGRDVTYLIRRPDVTDLSSVVSTIPRVRRAMVTAQRNMAKLGAILNGRDIGTVVFPDADLKFFLTASAETRAKRRFNEEKVESRSINLKETLREINKRDSRDSTRDHSPLSAAEDAIVIDSSDLTIEEVLEEMLKAVRSTVVKRNPSPPILKE